MGWVVEQPIEVSNRCREVSAAAQILKDTGPLVRRRAGNAVRYKERAFVRLFAILYLRCVPRAGATSRFLGL